MQKENKKTNANIIEVPLSLPSDISDDLYNDIMEVLQTTKFGKISFPLSSYRKFFDENSSDDDKRIITIGYIKKFDQKNSKFVVVLFNNNKDIVDKFETPTIEVVATQRNGKLGTITKLNLIDAGCSTEE